MKERVTDVEKFGATNPEYLNKEVKVFKTLKSDEVSRHIPLSHFTKEFQDMYESGLFVKVFLDYDKVTAKNKYGQFFVPKLRHSHF